MKIYKKEKINRSLWVIRCPKCGKILASASEKQYLPEFMWCDCESHSKEDSKIIE